MAQFIFAIILWLGAAVLAILAVFAGSPREDGYKSSDGPSRGILITGAVTCVLVGFALFAWGGVKSVPVKTIGVPVSFGAISGPVYGPGAHETWTPWLSLVEVDETVQTTTFEGPNCLTVRIGGQQTACADVTIQWQVLPAAADSLFQNYANHGNLMKTIENAVVVRELKQVVNQELGDYNPITDVQNVVGTSASSQFSKIGPVVLQQMQADIGSRIEVKNLLMPYIRYDSAVENKLNAIQQAYANYAIAAENVNVAHEQQLAFAKLGNPTMSQLVAQCLKEAETNHSLQCIPGATANLSISQAGK